MWSPYEIRIILHHYTTASEFPESHTQLFTETIQRFIGMGLLLRNDDGFLETTDMAAALVGFWSNTPLPVQKWCDPRLMEEVQ
jgi:hypothetical protein